MMKTRKSYIAGMLAMLMLIATMCFSMTTYAAGTTKAETPVTEKSNNEIGITPFGGANEVFPLGYYSIGKFTFTDTNITPVKIPAGRYIKIGVNFMKAPTDTGIGNVKLKLNIRDASTGAIISKTYEWEADPTNEYWTAVLTDKIDLGYANRRIQIWFDASSTGSSNGNFRSIAIDNFYAYTYA